MQPRSEKFFTLISNAGPNVVESDAILTEFAKRMHDTEHASDDTTFSHRFRDQPGLSFDGLWIVE
jgi:hypothetical protein